MERAGKTRFWAGLSFLGGANAWPAYAFIVLLVLWLLLGRNTVDMDLWGLLSFGRLFFQTFPHFPTHDVFSYTAPHAPWIYHEWGCEVLFYTLFQYLGSQSLFLLKCLLLVGMSLLILSCWRLQQCSTTSTQSLLFWGTLLSALYLFLPLTLSTLRCHLFSFLGFLFLFRVLEGMRLSKKANLLGSFLLVMLLWVNLHGGYVVVFFLLSIYAFWFAVMQRRKEALTVLLIGLVCLIITGITPYGYRLPWTLLSAWMHPRLYIEEWRNVFYKSGIYGTLYTALFLFWVSMAFRAFWQDKRKFVGVLFLLLITGVEGWLHLKMAPFFLLSVLGIGFSLPLPEWRWGWLTRLIEIARQPVRLLSLAMASVLLFLNVLLIATGGLQVEVPGVEVARYNAIIYPQGAVTFLQKHHIKGNLWTPFEWGEFLIWNLFPNIRVSIDGRYETLYPESVFLDARSFYAPPYSLVNAFHYPTDLILIPRVQEGLLQKLASVPDWTVIYQDSVAVLFSRYSFVPVSENPIFKEGKPRKSDAPGQSFPNASTDLDAFRFPAGRL